MKPELVMQYTGQAEGAIPNGTRVVKIVSDPGDYHSIGAKGTVRGSIGPTQFEEHGMVYGYWVQWDDVPEFTVFTSGYKLQAERGAEQL